MKELSPNKSATSINIDKLNTPVKRKGVSGWTKHIKDTNQKQSVQKDWKLHDRERHIDKCKQKEGSISNWNTRQGYVQDKTKKRQCNQKTKNYYKS